MAENDIYQDAAKGDLEKLNELLSTGFDINQGDDGGYTVLHWAAQEGQLETVAFLLERGADPLKQDDQLYTPMDVAVAEGRVEVVEFFLDTLEPESYRELSLLHVAAANGQTGSIRLLLERNWAVDQLDPLREDYTALRWAVQKGHLDVIQLLLAHGADVNAKDDSGMTPLYQAAADGNTEIVAYLLDHGAEIDSAANDGVTPLIIASCYFYSDQFETVKLLVQRGADI
ncbi:ankyrin repeat domain-containing protein [Planococcus sp. 1R117A]|uniref:ankyrin repeat domain-containing protein n=1 Tax=Planococcus sp. 1R117A TaxID=3447020 RepID=UPI003EDC0E86